MESDFNFESVSPSGGGRGSLRGRLSGFFSIDSTSRIDRGRDGACSFIFNSSAPGIDRGTGKESGTERVSDFVSASAPGRERGTGTER
jgi:hypothetical protein